MWTGDNWLLYLMLLLTQTPQLEHLLVSRLRKTDRWPVPCLWWDGVARRPEQWTAVDKVFFPRGQPGSGHKAAPEERNR